MLHDVTDIKDITGEVRSLSGETPKYPSSSGESDNIVAQGGAKGQADAPMWSVAPVYTGSAADYDKPSLIHVGTGEGSQVYGWGLYGSGVRGVAEGYAKNAAFHNLPDYAKSVVSDVKRIKSEPDYDPNDYFCSYDYLISSYEDNAKRHSASFDRSEAEKAEFYSNKAEWLRKNKDNALLEKGQILYSQTFFTNRAPGDESHLLSWYEPVSKENIGRIRKELENENVKNEWLADPGENDYKPYGTKDVYDSLTHTFGSPKAASEFLARADIDGIKYPVDSYGGKGVKDGDKAGWNYVSFRDDNIRVDHKWVDGEMMWSKAAEDRHAEQMANNSEYRETYKRLRRTKAWMKAPNGKPTRLDPVQWVLTRTAAFKKWFGDWEKNANIKKLRGTDDIVVNWENQYALDRASARSWALKNVRDSYTNKDTGDRIDVVRDGVRKVTSHGLYSEAHLKSISAIKGIVENSVFITEMPNQKVNGKYDSYRYYVSGMSIDGVPYTVKMVVGVKNGRNYYDHELTQIEKGHLLERLNGVSYPAASSTTPLDGVYDTKLLNILQAASASKVVDENGEPLVVYHGSADFTPEDGFHVFATNGRNASHGAGAFFASTREVAEQYAKDGRAYAVFLNIRNPKTHDWNGELWSEGNDDEAAAKRTYRKFGKVKLTDAWAEIPSGHEADYNFFKVSVEMK